MDTEQMQFKNNDIVWAKVIGHPWWPGMISQIQIKPNTQIYRVDFFGYPATHSLLPSSKIIRYEDYEKVASTENTGRMSPGLRKAITQASILFNTLQQSKTSPIYRACSHSCIFDNQNVITSISKSEEKQIVDQRTTVKDLQQPIAFSENQQTPVHKNRNKKFIIKKFIVRKSRKNQKMNMNEEQQSKQVNQLLKNYKLQIIPSEYKYRKTKLVKNKKSTQQEQLQTFKQNKYINRLLFRICRKRGYLDRKQSLDFIQVQNNVKNCQQLKQFINKMEIK